MSTSRLSSPCTHTYQRCVHPMTSSPHPHHHITPQQSDIVYTFLHCHPRDQQDFTRMSEGNVCVFGYMYVLYLCMYLCICVCTNTNTNACMCVCVCVCAYTCSYFFLNVVCVCVCVVLVLYIVGVCVHVRQSIHSLFSPPEIAIVGRAKLDMTYENGSLLLIVRQVRIVVMITPPPSSPCDFHGISSSPDPIGGL